jgi:ABC-type antimicrobial peptide transport system permease subunit
VSAVLIGLASALALALASAGLYAVISFLVARRTREIGVRMALGASRGRVAGDVARAALKLTVGGVAVGLVGVLLLRRFTAAMLYGVQPDDPWTVPGACLALLLVTALASLAPARRATRVDPLLAMRAE